MRAQREQLVSADPRERLRRRSTYTRHVIVAAGCAAGIDQRIQWAGGQFIGERARPDQSGACVDQNAIRPAALVGDAG